jgi:hypothetical protein
VVVATAHRDTRALAVAAQRGELERAADLIGERQREHPIAIRERAIGVVQHLQHAAQRAVRPAHRHAQHRARGVAGALIDLAVPARIARGVGDHHWLAGGGHRAGHAAAHRQPQIVELDAIGQPRAQLAGGAVDHPQRRALGVDGARHPIGARREQLVELDLACDHRAEIGEELEPLRVFAHQAWRQHTPPIDGRAVHATCTAGIDASVRRVARVSTCSTAPSRAAMVPGRAAAARASIAATCSSLRRGSWW